MPSRSARRSHLLSMNDVSQTSGGGRHDVGRAIHPGSGRRRSAPFPKGRVLSQAEVERLRALLGEAPRERALLIEYLHLIQDHEGALPAGLLHALAEELAIPMAGNFEWGPLFSPLSAVRHCGGHAGKGNLP